MLQGETPIATEVVHNLHWMHKKMEGACDSIFETFVIHTMSLYFAMVDSQVAHKIRDLMG